MLAVKLVGRAEIHRDAVLDDAVLFENRVEHFERPAAVHHEILGDDLKPIDDRFFRENVPVMRHAQADADAVFGETIESICGHDDSLVVRQKREAEDRTPVLQGHAL